MSLDLDNLKLLGLDESGSEDFGDSCLNLGLYDETDPFVTIETLMLVSLISAKIVHAASCVHIQLARSDTGPDLCEGR